MNVTKLAIIAAVPAAALFSLAVFLGPAAHAREAGNGDLYTTDFSEHPAGPGVPDGWTARWSASHYEIAGSPSRLVVTGIGTGRSLLAWDKAGVIEGDVEVAALVRQPDSTLPDMPVTRYQLHLHASEDEPDSYYVDDTGTGREGVRIRSAADDSQQTLGSARAPFSMSVWHHVVLQRRGDSLRAKVWPYFTEEPTEWTVETTDGTHNSGLTGVGFFSARMTQEFAWFSVATGEREAKRAPGGIAGIPAPRTPAVPRPAGRANYGAVLLDWNEVAGADFYEVERDGALIAHGWEPSSFADAAIPAGTAAAYRVRGISVLRGPGEWSQPITVRATGIPAELSLSFERKPNFPWTPHDEEIAFFEKLANVSPRFAFEEIGRSGEGRPIHLIRIGRDGPPADEEIARRPTLLLIGGNHGNEPAGRQGVLFLLRDLATSNDPEVLAWLDAYAILSVPTMNPDGRAANRRRLTAPDIDSNRDMLALTSSEARAIATVMRDHRPGAVIDAHEWGGSPGHQRGEFEISSAGNANAHPDVLALSSELAFDRIMANARNSAGWRSNPYQELYGQPTRVRQIAPLKHAVSLLTESSRHPEIRRIEEARLSRDDPGTHNRRAASQRFALSEALRFLTENLDRVTAATAASIAAANANHGPLYTDGDLVNPPTGDQALDPPPSGWAFTEPVSPSLRTVLDLHGIQLENRRLPGGRTVPFAPAAQWARPVAMIALDPDSAYRLNGVETYRLE